MAILAGIPNLGQWLHFLQKFSCGILFDQLTLSHLLAQSAESDKGNKLYKQPSVNPLLAVHPQSFHIQLVFQIVKALLHDVFVPVDLQSFSRILGSVGK